MDDKTRVQLVLGILIFGGTILGLLALGFLRLLDWQRARRAGATATGHSAALAPLQTSNRTGAAVDPYAIAEEALKLIDAVQSENTRLKQTVARYESKHPHGGTLPAHRWLAIVNDEPNLVPHLGIEGATRTGKTTLAEGILQERDGQVLIITAKTGDTWGGLPYITVDDDGSYTTAAATFRALHREVLRRLVAVKHGQEAGAWLTVVLDDYPALRDACTSANEPFLLIARIGASLRVRLLVLTYSLNVKELGLEGKGDARHHFAWIKRTRRGAERTATMQWEGLPYDLETAPVIAQASRSLDAGRAWQAPTQTPGDTQTETPKQAASTVRRRGIVSTLLTARHRSTTPDADALLDRLLHERKQPAAVPVWQAEHHKKGQNGSIVAEEAASDTPGTPQQEGHTTHTSEDTSSDTPESIVPAPIGRDLPAEVIRALRQGERWSDNHIARYLQGNKQKRLQKIEEAVAETSPPEAARAA